MQRNQAYNRICQVDIAKTYDHKHQSLSKEDSTKGLSRMSIDIAKTFIRKLAAQGDTFTYNTLRTMKATYYRTALDLLETYNNDAKINHIEISDKYSEKIAITTTTNVITDLVENIGGDHVSVTGLMGPGVDPHLYRPSASDVKSLQNADIIFYNGLDLEGKMGDIFVKIGREGTSV